jgi:hypothetical protein
MKTILIIILFCIFANGYGQNPFRFTFGGSDNDGCTGISLKGDTLLMSNTINNYLGITTGFSILYLNNSGDSIKAFSSNSYMNWTAKFITNNNTLASTGRYRVSNTNLDMALTCVNNGIVASYHYGGNDNELGYDLIFLPDSGFILVGTTQSYGAGANDVYIIRTDKNGDTLWTRTFGDANGQEAKGIEKQNDSVYIVAGLWGNINTNSTDPFAMKINLNGDTSDFHFYGNNLQNFGQSLCKTADGGFAIAGWSTVDYGGTYSPDGVIYKTDSNLNLQWTKYYGTIYNEDIFDIQSTYDNGFVLVGYSKCPGRGEDVYIVRTDSQGDTLWTKTLGGAYDERAYSVVQTPDSSFAVVGYTYSFGAGGSDAFFLKLKPNGDITTSIGLIPELKYLGIKLYPNPAKENITIDFKNALTQEAELFIYNALGQKLRSYSLQKHQSEINIGLFGIKSGVYYCELRTNNKTIGTGKFIKE